MKTAHKDPNSFETAITVDRLWKKVDIFDKPNTANTWWDIDVRPYFWWTNLEYLTFISSLSLTWIMMDFPTHIFCWISGLTKAWLYVEWRYIPWYCDLHGHPARSEMPLEWRCSYRIYAHCKSYTSVQNSIFTWVGYRLKTIYGAHNLSKIIIY